MMYIRFVRRARKRYRERILNLRYHRAIHVTSRRGGHLEKLWRMNWRMQIKKNAVKRFVKNVCTVAHKCTLNSNHSQRIQINSNHSQPNANHSHRNQITHTECKSLTPNSNHSHRMQITHTEFKSLTPNSNYSHRMQITHTECKSLTPNSNYSHRIQITHT